MVPLIGQLLQMGYTSQMILSYLGTQLPNLQRGIQSAQKIGHSADKILKFLSTNISPKNKQGYDRQLNANEKYLKGLGIKTRAEKEETRNKYIKGALGVGAGYLAGRGLGMLQGAQQAQTMQQPPQGPNNPPAPPAPPQGIAPTPLPMNPIGPAAAQPPGPPNTPTGPAPRQGPSVNAPQPNIGVAAQAQQPQGIPQKPDAKTTLDMLGIRDKVERMKAAGAPIEQIKISAEKSINPAQREELKGLGADYLYNILDDYFKQSPQRQTKERKLPDWLEGSKTYQPKKADVKQLDKGSTIITPEGDIAEVKSINKDNAIVNIDGKNKQVKASDAHAISPYLKDTKVEIDLADIPEDAKSAALNTVAPANNGKSVIVRYGLGKKFYLFSRKDGQPLDPSIIQSFIVGQKKPSTKGTTLLGGWDPSVGDSRGSAAYDALTRMAQNPDEPDDPNKPIIVEEFSFEEGKGFQHGFHKKFDDILSDLVKEFNTSYREQHGKKKKK